MGRALHVPLPSINRRWIAHFGNLSIVLLIALNLSCGEENDPLARTVKLHGKVTNASGVTGAIFAEIDYNLKDRADAEGRYEIWVHRDFYVDSLYAYVDRDDNGRYTQGEPHGFFASSTSPGRAQPFQVRNYEVGNLNITIP